MVDRFRTGADRPPPTPTHPIVTAARLLSWILAVLFAQVLVGLAIALWRRRGRAQPVAVPALPPATAQAGAAWQGTRAFRVRSRGFEDAACTQCSFAFEPVDGQPLPAFKPGQFLTFTLEVGAGVLPIRVRAGQVTMTQAAPRFGAYQDPATVAAIRRGPAISRRIRAETTIDHKGEVKASTMASASNSLESA